MARAVWYKLEDIEGERTNAEGRKEYLAKWAGYPRSSSTWEPARHFRQCDIDEWERNRQARADLDTVDEDEEAETDWALSGEMPAEEAPPSGSDSGNADRPALAARISFAGDEVDGSPLENRTITGSSRLSSLTSFTSSPSDATQTPGTSQSIDAVLEAHSESDDSDIPLPPNHTVAVSIEPPHTITGERDDGCFLVTWKHTLASGKPVKPAWVDEELVSLTLITAWHRIKKEVLNALGGSEEEAVARKYRFRMDQHFILIEPQTAESLRDQAGPIFCNGRRVCQ